MLIFCCSHRVTRTFWKSPRTYSKPVQWGLVTETFLREIFTQVQSEQHVVLVDSTVHASIEMCLCANAYMRIAQMERRMNRERTTDERGREREREREKAK